MQIFHTLAKYYVHRLEIHTSLQYTTVPIINQLCAIALNNYSKEISV